MAVARCQTFDEGKQIRRPSSEIKFRVVELKTPRFSTAIGSNLYAEDRVAYLFSWWLPYRPLYRRLWLLGSKLAFFSSSVMYADLKDVGTEPVCRLRLCNSTRNDARTSTFSFSRRVGRGSSADCLSGSARTAATTSSTASDWNACRLQPGGT